MIAGLGRSKSPLQKVLLLRGSLTLCPLVLCPLVLLSRLLFSLFSFAVCSFYAKLMRLNHGQIQTIVLTTPLG